jgi:hypothetical protein
VTRLSPSLLIDKRELLLECGGLRTRLNIEWFEVFILDYLTLFSVLEQAR